MLRSRALPSLLLLASLAGCATSQQARTSAPDASQEARPAPPEERTPPPPPPPAAPPRKKPPVVASVKPPAKAAEPAPAPPPPATGAQEEFACGPGGTLQRRVASERPGGLVAFGAGMTRPEKISGPTPLYTHEALVQGIQGQMLARCVLTREGMVRSCRILKSLPHLDEAVLSALCASRYTPVTHQGQPVDAEYTFNVRLTPP